MAGTQGNIHIHLRAWRRHFRLTLEQLANKIGSKISTISGWETGSRRVDLDDLTRLAAAYQVHPAALLFAPAGSKELDRLKMADELLSKLTDEDAADWIKMGKRLANSEGGKK